MDLSSLGKGVSGAVQSAYNNTKNSLKAEIDKLNPYPQLGNGMIGRQEGHQGYPPELLTHDVPMVEFTANYNDVQEKSATIYLPCPGNLSTNDSAAYGSADLKASRQAMDVINSTVKSGASGSGAIDTIKKMAGGGVDAMKGIIGENSAAKMDILTALSTDVPVVGEVLAYDKKVLMNPNTVTTFSSNGIRQYSYSFKLIPRSVSEADDIKSIINTFRKFTYASTKGDSGKSFVINYPPIWSIRYLIKVGGKQTENPYIARPFACYLTSVNTTYNGTAGSSYYVNGAPIEVDLQLSFQETRALFKDDIEKLENGVQLKITSTNVQFEETSTKGSSEPTREVL